MARRTKRPDGRYVVNIRVEQPDGTRKRAYFYGRPASSGSRSLNNLDQVRFR